MSYPLQTLFDTEHAENCMCSVWSEQSCLGRNWQMLTSKTLFVNLSFGLLENKIRLCFEQGKLWKQNEIVKAPGHWLIIDAFKLVLIRE